MGRLFELQAIFLPSLFQKNGAFPYAFETVSRHLLPCSYHIGFASSLYDRQATMRTLVDCKELQVALGGLYGFFGKWGGLM
jgi:hypothetical protein